MEFHLKNITNTVINFLKEGIIENGIFVNIENRVENNKIEKSYF